MNIMSVHVIYYQDGAKMMRPVHTREEYMTLRDSEWQKSVLKAVREGNESQKSKLIQMNYSCLPNEDGSLKGSTTMSTSVGMDIDHVPESQMPVLKDCILQKKDELGLLMLELSARGKGYHLVFKRRPELSQEENLRWASDLLGVDFDKAAKDITRVFFTTTREELLFLDDEIFCPLPASPKGEEMGEPKKEVSPRGNCPLVAEQLGSVSDGGPKGLEGAERAGERLFPTEYHGIPFTEILKKYWEVNNRGFEPTKGDRDTLTYQLACDLRHICGKNFEWLDQVIPCYDGFTLEEKRQKIQSALNSELEAFPARLRNTLNALKGNEESIVNSEALPPEMPSKLPKLIQLLVSKTPDIYKAAVAHAVFPALATHLCQVRFCYTDNVEHEATLMNCLMAGTGAGKGCIDKPIERIMADIERRDKENERREAEWKKDCQKKGANKDKLLRPEGLVIQIIDPDMTKPALVTRMDESEGHFVYVKLNELDLFEQLKGATGKQHFQLMCLAFDSDATYGQTRVGTQSVTARPMCRFNWNACSTILKGRRFFRNVLTDGPISRINFCTIPEQEIGSEQPIYGQYDSEFDEALKPYIDKLVGARGLIDCPQAYRLAQKLQQECAEFARLSQSDTYWNLSHRACVIAWLKACVLYVANGGKWEKCIEDFIRWSLNYDLWCKMQFFGADIERATHGEDSRIGTRGPRNLLELLPDEFTIEDAKRVRQQQGLNAGQKETARMVSNWKSRGYINQISDISFQKSEKYRRK